MSGCWRPSATITWPPSVPWARSSAWRAPNLTTGDFRATEVEDETALLTELQRVRPAEIVYPGGAETLRDLLRGLAGPSSGLPTARPALAPGAARTPAQPGQGPFLLRNAPASFGWILNGYDDWVFAPQTALFTVREHFGVASLDGFGLKDRPGAVGAVGAVLHYVTQHLRRDATSLTRLSFYQRSDCLGLDYTTLRNLEIIEPLHAQAPRNACLYGAVNRTVTPMGLGGCAIGSPSRWPPWNRSGDARRWCKCCWTIPRAWNGCGRNLAKCGTWSGRPGD